MKLWEMILCWGTTESVWEGGFLASLRALHLEREGSKKRERRGRRRFEERRRGFQQERLRRKREEDSHLKAS